MNNNLTPKRCLKVDLIENITKDLMYKFKDKAPFGYKTFLINEKTVIYTLECFIRTDNGIVMATTGFQHRKRKNHGFYSHDKEANIFVEYYHKILFNSESKTIYLYDRDLFYINNSKSDVKSRILHSKIRYSKLFDNIELIKADGFEKLIIVNY